MFEKASRMKLRFDTPAGTLSVEDLWDLPLTSKVGSINLDDIARAFNRQVSASEESFVDTPAKANVIVNLSFDIVKYVIGIRLEERDAAKSALVRKEKKAKILEILASKKDESLRDSTPEELEKMLEELAA